MEKEKSTKIDDEQTSLAVAAAALFKAKHYEKCLETLQKLKARQASQGEAEDLRVQHNIVIAQYYAQGCHEPQKLLEQLEKTKKKMEERRKQHGADSAEEGVYAAALEGALLGYNEAYLLASTKHYSAAIALLEPLYRHIEPLDEFLTLKICFLLLELYHVTFQPDKATAVALHLEKAFLSYFLHPSLPNASPQQSPGPLAADLSAEEGADAATNALPPPGPKSQPKTNVNLSELKAHVHLARARTFLLPSVGTSSSSAASSSSSSSSSSSPSAAASSSSSAATSSSSSSSSGRNLSAAKKELKLAQQAAAENTKSGTAVHQPLLLSSSFVKAQIEFLHSHHAKALKIIQQNLHQPVSLSVPLADRSAAERLLQTCSQNAIGCIHMRQKHFRSAAFAFNRALQENNILLAAERPHAGSTPKELKLLSTTPFDKRVEILYNVALAQLHSGNAELAFSCLQEVLSFYAQSPRIWLRLAECCVAIHQSRQKHEELRPELVGASASRRVILTRVRSPKTTADEEKSANTLHQVASLEYANKCLVNVLLLCGQYSQPSATHAQQQFPLAELQQLRFAALLNLSFVQLMLGHFAAALSAANQLLASSDQATMPPHIRFSARMYAAEALCRLDRSGEAMEHFAPVVLDALRNTFLKDVQFSSNVSGTPSVSTTSTTTTTSTPRAPSSSSSAPSSASAPSASNPNQTEGSTESSLVQRILFYVNSASALVLTGDVEKANQSLRDALHSYAASHHQIGSHATSALMSQISTALFVLGVYIALRRGQADRALDQLKRGRTYFLAHANASK